VTQTISYQIEDRLYLNITDRCTLVCAFCPKTLGHPEVQGYNLSIDNRPTAEQIIAEIGDPTRYAEIVFCGYGEPTLRLKVLLEVAHYVKDQGGKVRINTDGLANLVHKRNVLPEMADCIDSLSVSMNAQNEAVYNRHCQPELAGSFEAMLEFLKLAPNYIKDVTTTALQGLEGVDIAACEQLAKERGVKFRTRYLGRVG
jgi:TatD family-associated radical SAM protein